MSQETHDLIRMLAKWFLPEDASVKSMADFVKRALVCTPFNGAYGAIAG